MVSALNSVSIPVRGGYDGKLAPGFTAEPPVFEPSSITVTGPEAYLKDVSYAWVSFGIDQVAETTYTKFAIACVIFVCGFVVNRWSNINR